MAELEFELINCSTTPILYTHILNKSYWMKTKGGMSMNFDSKKEMDSTFFPSKIFEEEGIEK